MTIDFITPMVRLQERLGPEIDVMAAEMQKDWADVPDEEAVVQMEAELLELVGAIFDRPAEDFRGSFGLDEIDTIQGKKDTLVGLAAFYGVLYANDLLDEFVDGFKADPPSD